jgi:PAS domain S-box-containing protein
MEEKKTPKITEDELSTFTDSYAHFNKITQKLQLAYQELEKRFEDLNLKLEETNNQLRQSLVEKDKISNYLNNILESISSGVLVINSVGKITLFNRAAGEITGYQTDEVLGKDYLEIMGKGVGKKATPLHTLETGISHLNEEKEILDKNDNKIPLGFSTSILTDGENNQLGAVEVFFDLSHIKKLEQEIARVKTLAALGEMAATVAHEVRNPLGGIAGFAAILEKDLSENDPRRKWVKKIIEGVENLNRIVINLLNYTKVVKFSPNKVDFLRFLDDTLNFFLMDLSAQTRNIEIIKNYPPEKFECLIDVEQFRQVVLNLLRNSVQALPEGGKIEVLTRPIKDKVIFKISDSGVGMDEQTQKQLFNPFFTTKEGGTGLGLSTVKKIVDAHKGEIEIESEKSKGTTVTVSLPRGRY